MLDCFVDLRRLSLVLCKTFIHDEVSRYLAMSVICQLALVCNIHFKPYESKSLNMISSVSIFAQATVAFIGTVLSGRSAYGSFDTSTYIFLIYFQRLSLVFIPLTVSFLLSIPWLHKYASSRKEKKLVIV